MNLNERNIFLLDGVGALISAIFTGLILPLFSQELGLPSGSLYFLAMFPLMYSAYSLTCFWLAKTIRPFMLKAIIMANLLYCVISGFVIFSLPNLNNWGSLLLSAEILIVLVVVAIERHVYRKFFILRQTAA